MQSQSQLKVDTIVVNFDYNTASPMTLLNVPPGIWVDKCDVVITDEFDDAAATLQAGTVASPSLFLATNQIDPTVKGTYSSDDNHKMLLAEILRLTLDPGASTKGSGTVILTIRRG